MNKLLILFCGLLAVFQAAVSHDFNTRIVNGQKALPGEIPFQVSLQTPDAFHFCGGSILNEKYVVTAAHCVYGKAAEAIYVVAGTILYKEPLQKICGEEIIVHEKYASWDNHRNDIALIQMQTSFKYNQFIQPVLLIEQSGLVEAGAPVVVSGWGDLGFGSTQTPLELMKAEIKVASQQYCRSVVKAYGYDIYSTNICAHDVTERRGQCNGDSGGPLTYDGKLVGIVSWSIKDPYCASTKYPGVYTRVSEYVDWIKEHSVY